MNFESIMTELRKQVPKVEDEEAFIDSIMESLPDMPEEERTSPYIIMLRTVSSLAAAVVIGWFVFLNVGGSTGKNGAADDGSCGDGGYVSAYANMSRYATPQEAIKDYSTRQKMDINKLISMYDGN